MPILYLGTKKNVSRHRSCIPLGFPIQHELGWQARGKGRWTSCPQPGHCGVQWLAKGGIWRPLRVYAFPSRILMPEGT